MVLEDLAGAVVLIAMIAYTLFGGADFGGGVWTALASGKHKNEQRESIMKAIGPIWETNHIWLVLIVVTLFNNFPGAFGSLFVALLVPLVIVLVGVVFRGAAFAFRHFGGGKHLPATTEVFSIASIITPIAMGMAVGAVASGKITIANGTVTSSLFAGWLTPFGIICGLVGLSLCAMVAAFYMTTRTEGELREDFRTRGLLASLAVGILTTIAIPVAYWNARPFFDRLIEPIPLVLIGLSVVAGLVSLGVLWQRKYLLAPIAAGAVVTMVIAAWGLAQFPYIIMPNLSLHDAAAGTVTLAYFLIALAAGSLVLLPSLYLLYRTFSEKTGGAQIDRPLHSPDKEC